jgi:hypothetical protein
MKVLVFGNTYETARMHLLNMVDDMKYGDIKMVKNSMCETYVELKNGDIYQALSASESARGYKCDKVYINKEIDSNVVDRIIRPMLVISKLPEEEQIVVY